MTPRPVPSRPPPRPRSRRRGTTPSVDSSAIRSRRRETTSSRIMHRAERGYKVSVIGMRSLGTTLLLLALASAAVACKDQRGRARDGTAPSDSAFAAMQSRGEMVMGVNQYTSAHVFEDLPTGGRLVPVHDPHPHPVGRAPPARPMPAIAA